MTPPKPPGPHTLAVVGLIEPVAMPARRLEVVL